MRAYLALFIPLLREVFRLADQLAQALESRGFSAPSRTSIIHYRWRMSDVLVVLLSVAGCVAVFLFGR